MTWETIEPGIWKPEKEGDTIEGVLIGKEADRGSFGSYIYNIETVAGQHLGVWGSTVLDDRMKYVPVGSRIRIVFKGIERNAKGQPIKIFAVQVDKGVAVEVKT